MTEHPADTARRTTHALYRAATNLTAAQAAARAMCADAAHADRRYQDARAAAETAAESYTNALSDYAHAFTQIAGTQTLLVSPSALAEDVPTVWHGVRGLPEWIQPPLIPTRPEDAPDLHAAATAQFARHRATTDYLIDSTTGSAYYVAAGSLYAAPAPPGTGEPKWHDATLVIGFDLDPASVERCAQVAELLGAPDVGDALRKTLPDPAPTTPAPTPDPVLDVDPGADGPPDATPGPSR